MARARDVRTLHEVLRRMATASEGDTVCVEQVMDTIGQRSFGPLLLAPSLVVASPLSGIPGVPTVSGLVMALIAAQMLIGRQVVWLPRPFRRRCVNRQRFEKAVAFLYPAARVADGLVRPRLALLTHPPFNRFIAAICIVNSLLMPPLELVPFASSILAASIAAFALSLIAHDGVLAIIALVITIAGFYIGLGAIA